MKKFLIVPMLGILAGAAYADEEVAEQNAVSPYAAFRVGVGGLGISDGGQDGRNGGLTLAGAVGARIKINNDLAFRVEGEAELGSFSNTQGLLEVEQNTVTFMANAYIDFMTSYRLKPYVGFGIGTTLIQEEMSVFGIRLYDESTSGFTYGLYGGVGFNLTDTGNVLGDVGVRYRRFSAWDANINIFTVNAGLRVVF